MQEEHNLTCPLFKQECVSW